MTFSIMTLCVTKINGDTEHYGRLLLCCVINPECHKVALYAECHYNVCHYGECRGANFRIII
jgi:hypothetical protein